MAAFSNILLIRLKSIGDILFTLPAVHVVRENFPQSHITYLTSRENSSLLTGFTAVDEVITLDRNRFRRGKPLEIISEALGLWRKLRARRYDLVVDFQGYGETAWLTWLSRSPQRWGMVYRRARAWAYTRKIWRNNQIHPIDAHLFLLEKCELSSKAVRNDYQLPEAHIEAARAFIRQQGGQPEQASLYLQPFTSSPAKNWPIENYLALADFWRQRGVQAVFSGGPSDRPALESASKAGFIVAAGGARLTNIGLMKLCKVIVGGDTGFLHLAVAMEKRVVMLMHRAGSGTPLPYGHPDWVVSPPDNSALDTIPLEQVISATRSAMMDCGIPGI